MRFNYFMIIYNYGWVHKLLFEMFKKLAQKDGRCHNFHALQTPPLLLQPCCWWIPYDTTWAMSWRETIPEMCQQKWWNLHVFRKLANAYLSKPALVETYCFIQMRFIINLVVNINQSWSHIPSWRWSGLRRLSCSLLSRLCELWEHRWPQTECVWAVFPTKVAEMGTLCFSEKKGIQAGNVSGGKYQVDGSQDSALLLETENHSNCSCFCSSTLICDS